MVSAALPTDLAHITPEHITQILRTSGVISQANVTAQRAEIVTGEVSFHAQIVRLHLRYDRIETGAPSTLILKLPTPDPALHVNAAVFQPGAKENWFYQHIALRNHIAAPRCYYSAYDPATRQSILALADLGSARRISQVAGVSATEAQSAIAALARLHASWWEQQDAPAIKELQRINGTSDAGTNVVEKLYAEAWPQFIASGIVELPTPVSRFGEQLVGQIHNIETRAVHSPKTLVHGDFRLDNMLFDLQTQLPICWLLDWEDVAFDNPAIDLSWFLGGCLQLAASHHEEELLRFYHHSLGAAGVTGYAWAQCWHDYRCAMISSFVQGILSSTINENATAYRQQFAQAVASRFIAACQRLRLSDLLTGVV